jgi:hypothetical protein
VEADVDGGEDQPLQVVIETATIDRGQAIEAELHQGVERVLGGVGLAGDAAADDGQDVAAAGGRRGSRAPRGRGRGCRRLTWVDSLPILWAGSQGHWRPNLYYLARRGSF